MFAPRRFFNLWRKRSIERELEEELRFHTEMRIEANLRAGMDRDEAEAEARRHLGNPLRVKEGMREARVSYWMDSCAYDLRYGVRLLSRQTGSSLLAVLTLSLGIGATTAIFSVVHGVLIKPLPYPKADELVRIAHTIGGVDQPWFSDAIYVTYLENNQTFQDIGVWSSDGTATITGHGDPEEVHTLPASRGVLTALGVRPELGRWFSENDDMPRAPATVILTNGYWQRRFGGDSSVVGRFLTVNSIPHQIIGVMPTAFRFGREPDIILPLRLDRGRLLPSFRLLGVARLKPGVTLAQANADVARMLEIWFDNFRVNVRRDAQYAPSLRPLKQDVVGDVEKTLWVLMGTIGIVLLMACANVANMLLVRSDTRRRELAIRSALGARWTGIARALLVESLTLALLAGVLGLGFAYAGLQVLVAIGPPTLPRLSEIAIDPVVLGFALAVSLASGLLFGLVPILKYACVRFPTAAPVGGRSAGLTLERQRSRNALVAVQMALAFVLLVSSGLMIRSFQSLRSVKPGFGPPHHVQTFSISIPATQVADPERVTRMQHEIMDNISRIPGVTSAAFATRLPMENARFSAAITAADKPEDRATPPNRHVKFVSPAMFSTLQIPLIVGRDFNWTDLHERHEVAIISENLSREIWGSPTAALGMRIREFYKHTSPWREIVGVVGDVYDDGAHQLPPPTVYWPAQSTTESFGIPRYQPRRISVAVRSERAGTQSLVDQVHEAVWSRMPFPSGGVKSGSGLRSARKEVNFNGSSYGGASWRP
jgi:putative ABC transport system permease protein